MHQKACEIGPQTEAEVDRYVSPAASPSRRSDHGRVLFPTRTLLFLVDCEKSCLGATVRQRGVAAEIRRTNHDRRLGGTQSGPGPLGVGGGAPEGPGERGEMWLPNRGFNVE